MKGYRTFAIAALAVVAGGIAAIQDTSDWRSWALLATGALMAGLRAITDSPPGRGGSV